MKRLAVILPYDKYHIENFTNHFMTMVNEDKFYLIIMELLILMMRGL